MRERATQREDMKSNEWLTIAVRLTMCTCVCVYISVPVIMYKRFLNEEYSENLKIVHKMSE